MTGAEMRKTKQGSNEQTLSPGEVADLQEKYLGAYGLPDLVPADIDGPVRESDFVPDTSATPYDQAS